MCVHVHLCMSVCECMCSCMHVCPWLLHCICLPACFNSYLCMCISVHVARCAPSQCEEDVPVWPFGGPLCVLSSVSHACFCKLVALFSKSAFPAPGCGPTEQVCGRTLRKCRGPGRPRYVWKREGFCQDKHLPCQADQQISYLLQPLHLNP